MKKCSVVLFCISLLFVLALSPADVNATKQKRSRAPASRSPTVVPGTELRGPVATVKPGYEFIQQENGVVGVVNTRTNAIMGTYTCPCKSTNPNSKCELIFSPTYLVCKGGSCGGNAPCVLVGNLPTMRAQ
jgi:hypothetical protein